MYDEILEIIKKYGMPQDWNDDGKYGPEKVYRSSYMER